MDESSEQFLLSGDYEKLAEFYEQAIATEPDNISHYWDLSLAYLLQEKEEEAQGIWLSIFTQIEDAQEPELLAELVNILDTEATRQTNQETYQLAWILRCQIQQLAPLFIKNILELIKLAIVRGNYEPNFLEEWEVSENLVSCSLDQINQALLSEVLLKALEYPSELTVNFFQASLNFIELDADQFSQTVLPLGGDPNKTSYVIQLIKAYLERQPDNLQVIKDLFWLYFIQKKYDEASTVGHDFYHKCQSISSKIYGNYQLLSLYLQRGDWLSIPSLAQRHKDLIKEMKLKQDEAIEPYLLESFLTFTLPLLYCEDNPQENRPLQNYTSALFQQQSTPVIINSPRKHQKLKIGYIAHTLRYHSVGWLSRWLFKYHNKENFEIAIYLLIQPEDELTEKWFKPAADIFYNFQRDTTALIKQIQTDEIDILIDLDSLTLSFTCQVLAAKPAPIQATWLGLDASGLPAIDYFIADPYVLPENAQSYYQETIWRLPKTYLAIDGFEVGVPNRRREDLNIEPDSIIYLIVQGAPKRHPDNIRLQMRIVKAVNNSYLLIKGNADEEITVNLYTTIAQEEGVVSSRLRFLPFDKNEETHRANLSIADVVLDTYPYNGATTTLEVLWMGIPLVTRVGEQFAARNSYTFMVNAGLSEGIAYSDEEYVQWGIKLGKDAGLREQVTALLRESRKTSPLWNGKEFTQEMEKAYEQMWAIYQQNLS